MADRERRDLPGYFVLIYTAISHVLKFCDEKTIFIQVVSFSEPEWQLARYLEASRAAGLKELRVPILADERDGRVWRSVPNRRWHADQLGNTHGSQEVVLFHRRLD